MSNEIFYIYKITNNINGKFYVGKHKTSNINDGYFGSGKLLKRAISKHGIDNFSKQILLFCDSIEELNEVEKQIVTTSFVANTSTYNICVGGQGGFSHINDGSEEHLIRCRKGGSITGNENVVRKRGFLSTGFDHSQHNRDLHRRGIVNSPSFAGKTHSDESRRKIGDAKRGKNNSMANSQYGTMWITNGYDNMKINKTDDIPEGWNKGRSVRRCDVR